MNTFSIRKAVAEDLPSLIDLSVLFAEYHHNFDKTIKLTWFVSDKRKNKLINSINDTKKCVLVAINEEQKIIAYLLGDLYEKEDLEKLEVEQVAKLEELFVSEKYRSLGVGSQMLKSFFEWGSEKGAEFVQLDVMNQNSPGIKFYEKIGFQPYSTTMEARIPKKVSLPAETIQTAVSQQTN